MSAEVQKEAKLFEIVINGRKVLLNEEENAIVVKAGEAMLLSIAVVGPERTMRGIKALGLLPREDVEADAKHTNPMVRALAQTELILRDKCPEIYQIPESQKN